MKGIGYGEDIKAVDVFEHIKIFKVFRFDTVRHAGVGDHYSSATGKSLKLFSRRKTSSRTVMSQGRTMFRSRPPGSASAKASSLSRLRATSPTTAPRDAY